MWKQASDRIHNLQIRLASLQHRLNSPSGYVPTEDDYINLNSYDHLYLVASQIKMKIQRNPAVKVDATGSQRASLTGAQMKKAIISALMQDNQKRVQAYLRQNEKIDADIAELTGTGKRISKDKKEKIQRLKRKYVGEETFQELEAGLAEFKKIKVSKKGGIFTVKK